MKKDKPLISIIVPVYNIERYIEKCILSILSQSYENVELILVDDGSTDKSAKICDKYKDMHHDKICVIHQKNGGLSDARNKGIEVARGEFITLIDGDDFVDPDYIEVLFNVLVKYDADMSIGAHKVVYPKKVINKPTKREYAVSSDVIMKKMLYDDGIDLSAWGKLYKKKLFDGIKYPEGRLFEDSATTYKLIDRCKKIAVSPCARYNYVMREKSIVNEQFSEKKMDLIISTSEMVEYIRKKYPMLSKGCDRRMMYAYLSTLSQLAKSKSPNKKVKKRLMTYIKKNRAQVLRDRQLPRRDRIALVSTYFGFGFYKSVWRFYSIVTGRT